MSKRPVSQCLVIDTREWKCGWNQGFGECKYRTNPPGERVTGCVDLAIEGSCMCSAARRAIERKIKARKKARTHP